MHEYIFLGKKFKFTDKATVLCDPPFLVSSLGAINEISFTSLIFLTFFLCYVLTEIQSIVLCLWERV